jgi:transcriptional regulator with XRE-family HTH domain
MLGETLKTYREARGLTLQALAEQIGVSETYIRQVESGMRPQMSWDTVQRAAHILRIPLYKLVETFWAAYPPLAELRAAGLPEDRQEQLRTLWPRIPHRLRPPTLHVAFALARVEILFDGDQQRPGGRR